MEQFIVVAMVTSTVFSATTREINITEFQSCLCDLTEASCDVYCCCDPDCTELQKLSFVCKVNQQMTESDWSCSSNLPTPEKGIFLLLCIEKENNPYLGLYYPNYPALKGLPSVNHVLHKKKSTENAFAFVTVSQRQRVFMKPGDERGYVFGQNLVVISKNLQTAELHMPYTMFNTKCDFLHPVQYLKDLSSVCLISVKNSCGTTQMNSRSFTLEHGNKQLLSTPDDNNPLEDVIINYYSVTEPCCYVKNQACSVYGCNSNKLKSYQYNNPEFSALKNGICYNSVLETKYVFLWKGNRILSANITIVLGHIPASDDYFISQKFSVIFTHFHNNSRPRRNSLFSVVGYTMRDQLIGLSSDSKYGASEMNNFTKTHLFMLKNDASGKCTASSEPVLFGVDRFSGCRFRFEDNDVVDCSTLRERVSELMSGVLWADYVSRNRAFDPGNRLQVIHSAPSPGNRSDESLECPDVPDHVHLEVTYGEVFRSALGPAYRIIAAVRRSSSSEWTTLKSGSGLAGLSSSVKFRFISIEEEKRRLRTKRSRLPLLKSWEVPEVNRWGDTFYPFLFLDREAFEHRLERAVDVIVLIAVFLISAAFFGVLGGRHIRLSARRA